MNKKSYASSINSNNQYINSCKQNYYKKYYNYCKKKSYCNYYKFKYCECL